MSSCLAKASVKSCCRTYFPWNETVVSNVPWMKMKLCGDAVSVPTVAVNAVL